MAEEKKESDKELFERLRRQAEAQRKIDMEMDKKYGTGSSGGGGGGGSGGSGRRGGSIRERVGGINPWNILVWFLKWGGLILISWFVAMSLGNPILILFIFLFGVGILWSEMAKHKWARLILCGTSFALILLVTVWPLLSTFIAGGLPTFQFSLFEWFGISGETFNMLSNPEYYVFSMMNPTHFERTTTSDAPNVALEISSLQASPATNCFGNQFIVTYVVENEGDEPLKVGTGLNVPILGALGSYPCPCEILKSEEATSYADADCSLYESETTWLWSDDWADRLECINYADFAGCAGTYAIKQLLQTRTYSWYDVISNGDNALYDVTNPTPLEASSCGYFGTQVMQPGVPYQKVCQNVVYYPTNANLTLESCQIKAFARFTDWSSAVLPIQFVDTDYYVMRDLAPYTQPSTTSTGGVALSLSAGQQPLLDSYNIMSLTAGISNAGSGQMRKVHMMYLFVPKDMVDSAGDVCTSGPWSCGGAGNCEPDVRHCEICGCPGHTNPNKDYICSATDISKCSEVELQDGTCASGACTCPTGFLLYEDLCGSLSTCFCYKTTGTSTDAESCNILPTIMEAGQADDFEAECALLADDYHVCVLPTENIAQYTLYNCPIDVGGSIDLGENELRKSFIARVDAFYDYEITSPLTVSGVKCG